MGVQRLQRSVRSGRHAGVLLGDQRPRIWTAPQREPDPLHSSADEFIRLAESCGLYLDPWQRWVLEITLAEDPESGFWEAFEVCLIIARQNGKGAILEALELGWVFLLGETVAHTAQLHSTSKDAYGRFLGLVRKNAELSALVPDRLVKRSADDWSVTTLDGGRIEFGPRSSRTGRGTGKDKVVYDEAMFLSPEEIAGQVPTMSTRDNPQLWYTSSAGRKESEHLLSLRNRGRAGAKFDALALGEPVPLGLDEVEPEETPGLAYVEFSFAPINAAGEVVTEPKEIDIDHVDQWKRANPGLGKRISLHYVRNERRVMARFPEKFARERGSVFDEPAVVGRVITDNMWKACIDEGAAAAGAAVFAVTVHEERESATITAAGWRADGSPLVEIVSLGPAGAGARPVPAAEVPAAAAGVAAPADPPVAPGLRWVLQWFAERKGARVVLWQSSPAGALSGRLTAAGAEVTKASSQQMARASQAFYDAVRSGDVAHLGDEVMAAAVAAGRKRDLPEGAWCWSPGRSDGDIGPLVGASLALDELTSGAAERIYPEYHPDRHTPAVPLAELDVDEDDPDTDPASWRRVWTYSMGARRPLVWQCWAVEPDGPAGEPGAIWLEHEVYRLDADPAEVAAEIISLALPSPHNVLSDTGRDMRRPFELALGVSARPPIGDVLDGIQAVRHRLSTNALMISSGTLHNVDPGLRRAARPTCTVDEFAGYVWPADRKETPCGDAYGLDGLRWAVSHVDLRPRGRMTMLG